VIFDGQMPTARSFPELLRQCRTESGLLQRQLAERAGFSRSRLSSYEAGNRQPTLGEVNRILRELHLQVVLCVEPLDADIDRELAEAAGLSATQRLRRIRGNVIGLLQHFADVEPILEGAAAAIVHGLAVPARFIDVAIHPRHLDNCAALIMAMNCTRWSDVFGEYSDLARRDPRLAGALQWSTPLGELRIRLSDDPPPHITLMLPDPWESSRSCEVRVAGLATVQTEDPDTARMTRRALDRMTQVASAANATAPAVATFNESTPSAIGIRTHSSAALNAASDNPGPSAPSSTAHPSPAATDRSALASDRGVRASTRTPAVCSVCKDSGHGSARTAKGMANT
jgi:transcriptional regulator with XRE-family HTH domain